MAEVLELVTRSAVAVPASPTKVQFGDAFDVEDWEEIVVQIDTLSYSTPGKPVKLLVQSALSDSDRPSWATAGSAVNLASTTNGSAVNTVSTGLRRMARLMFQSTSSSTNTIAGRARVLKKKRALPT